MRRSRAIARSEIEARTRRAAVRRGTPRGPASPERRPTRPRALRQLRRSAPAPSPPCAELADDAAAECENADDENAAGDDRDPFAEPGQIILETGYHERADDGPEDRAHSAQQRHQHDLARHRPMDVGQ